MHWLLKARNWLSSVSLAIDNIYKGVHLVTYFLRYLSTLLLESYMSSEATVEDQRKKHPVSQTQKQDFNTRESFIHRCPVRALKGSIMAKPNQAQPSCCRHLPTEALLHPGMVFLMFSWVLFRTILNAYRQSWCRIGKLYIIHDAWVLWQAHSSRH